MEYVVFKILEKKYAVQITEVREICNKIKSTIVHGADKRVIGLINLRGQIVSIVNLKKCIDLKEYNEKSNKEYLIILNIDKNAVSSSGSVLFNSNEDSIGFSVDEIDNVLNVEKENIEAVPAHLLNPYIDGIIRLPEELISILNPLKIMESIIISNKLL